MNQPDERNWHLCRALAKEAHEGQFRRDGQTPYITHPDAVVKRVVTDGPEYWAVAILHDVLEDTATTASDLYAAGVAEETIEAVKILTRDKNEDYAIYLTRVKQHPVARRVKIADMLHNLSDTPTNAQILKYAKGLLFLLS